MPDDNNNLPNTQGPQTTNPVVPLATPPQPPIPEPVAPTFPTETDFPLPPLVGVPEANDLPPIISPPPKKFGGKKIIATILGLLLLIGGVGAGIILVKQQQDIREKAFVPECVDNSECDECYRCRSYKCVKIPGCKTPAPPPTPKLTPTPPPACPNTDCNIPADTPGAVYCKLPDYGTTYCCPLDKPLFSDGKCIASIPPPTSTPKPDGGKCSDASAANCQGKNPGDICRKTFKCKALPNQKGPDGKVKCFCDDSEATPTPIGKCNECNAQKQCVFRTCTGASLCQTNNDCQPMSGQCTGVKAYDKDWKPIVPRNEAPNLKAGDIIYFAVQGSGGPGTYDKAQFKFKGTQMPVIIDKKPGIGFYKQYQVTSNDIGKDITVKGRIHNSVMGWSETTGWTEDWPED